MNLQFHLAETEEATEDILGSLRALRLGRVRTRRQFEKLIRALYGELCLHLPYHTKRAERLLLCLMPEETDAERMKGIRKSTPRCPARTKRREQG